MNIKEDLKKFIKIKTEELELRYAEDKNFAIKADRVCERLDYLRDKTELICSKIYKISDRFIIKNIVKIIKIVVYIIIRIVDEIFNIFEGKKISTIVSSIVAFELVIIFSFIFKIGSIKKAEDVLYMVTGVSKENVKYEYNPERSFIADYRVEFKYYIFTVNKGGKLDVNINFAVNRSDKTVYICLSDTDKILIPYGYYVDDSSINGKYYNKVASTRYELLPEKTRIYIEKYGTEKFLYKVDEILNNLDNNTNEFDCNPLSYVNKVLSEEESVG